MSDAETFLYEWAPVGDVAVVEVASDEVVGLEMAERLRDQLRALIRAGQTRLLLNFGQVRFMSSNGFGALFEVWREAVAAVGRFSAGCSAGVGDAKTTASGPCWETSAACSAVGCGPSGACQGAVPGVPVAVVAGHEVERQSGRAARSTEFGRGFTKRSR